MFESVFRFLFKYERLVFEQGQFVLGATRSMWLVAAIVAAVAVYAVWTYWQVAALGGRSRVVLLASRVALLGVALFAILRPMLLLKVAVPQQNFVGIILDDSRSMQVADESGQAACGLRPRVRSGRQTRRCSRPWASGSCLACFGSRVRPSGCRPTPISTFQGTGTRLGDALRSRARGTDGACRWPGWSS